MTKADVTGYLASISLAGKMLDSGLISRKEFYAFEEKMRLKFGIEKGSIYRDYRLLCVPGRGNIAH